jgi:DNA damage-inducible protein 1
MTIMTSTFVEQCHLARLIDKRFKGMAQGVGSSAILGRVHQAPLKVTDASLAINGSLLNALFRLF